ncbi:MAG TPA: tol-pal system protein YbgF [Syntrophorhabdaceae bacterium]|jgi:tol-pal system protein YbgF
MKRFAIAGVLFLLAGCASSSETDQLRRHVMMTDQELGQFKTETSRKIASLNTDIDNIRKQMLTVSASTDEKEDKYKSVLGKVDELQHQLDTYWKDTKKEIAALKKGGGGMSMTPRAAPQVVDASAEAPYKDAFDTFQKGMYKDAIQKFTAFVDAYPKSTLAPNALFWLGESYMMQRDYDKAIVSFQDLLDKYPKTDMAPKALLSQADAFLGLKDKKSSVTILKKVIELYPKSEEAVIAERKLRNINL